MNKYAQMLRSAAESALDEIDRQEARIATLERCQNGSDVSINKLLRELREIESITDPAYAGFANAARNSIRVIQQLQGRPAAETSPAQCDHSWVTSNFEAPRCLWCHVEKSAAETREEL